MAIRDLFRQKKLADTPQKLPAGGGSEVGVAGELVFTGIDNEEKRVDNITINKYRKMIDTDDVAQALYLILTLPILATTFKIVADKEDTGETQASVIRDNLLRPPHKGGIETPLDLVLAQMLLATIEGFQLFNRVYHVGDNGYILYKKLAHRDSLGITLKRDQFGGYAGARQQVVYNGKQIDVHFKPEETFLFTYDKARGYLYGRSAFKTAYTNYDRKRRLEYLDGIGLQSDAIKAKIMKRTEQGSLGDDEKKSKSRALAALAKLGELKPVASIPFGWEVQELNSEGRDPGPSIERQNAGMARSVLAQFIMLGTQGKGNVGSYALSENHSDLFMLALKGLMQNIENHFNFYIIPDLIDMNFADPHYPEFRFDDLTSDVQSIMKDAFMKLIEKDRVSSEIVEGIMISIASKLEIDVEKIRKDLDKKKKDEENDKKGEKDTPPSDKPDDDDEDGDGDKGNKPNGSKANLSDVSARDFPGLYDALGIETDKLGCIMLDVQTFDVRKHVEGADADLYISDEPHSGGAVAETEAHVTLLYGLLQNGNIIKDKVDKVLEGWKVNSLVVVDVGSFEVAPDAPSVPIVAYVSTNSVYGAYDGFNKLKQAHDRLALLPHINTFSDYQPHVTLAYVKNDPDIVQKWVKALSAALHGMRLSVTGLNYGDLPEDDEDEEDDADSGSKFRQPELSDDVKWPRELTLAEQRVDFSQLQKKMDHFEQQFSADIKPIFEHIKDEISKAVKPLLESNDIAAINKLQLQHGDEYREIIARTMKTAYEFSKTGTADELKLPSPATKKETTALITQHAQSIVDKQFSDLLFAVKSEIFKDLRKRTLADYELSLADVLTAIVAAYDAFFDTKISLTGAIVVSQAVNLARGDVFTTHRKQIACYQYSSLLDRRTCPTCRALDGRVVDEKEYRATPFKTPIHGWCRCIWIAIKKDQQEIPPITGLPDKPGGAESPWL